MAKKRSAKTQRAEAGRVAKKKKAVAPPKRAKPSKPVKKARPARAVAKKVAPARKKALSKAAKPVAKKASKAVVRTPVKKKPAVAAPVRTKVAAVKPKPVAKAATGLKKAPLVRRDGAGHLNPRYAADLRRRMGKADDEGSGFIRESHTNDDLAEVLGEQFVASVTTAEDDAEQYLSQDVPEDTGGPFVPSTAGKEFADGTDASNPPGADREPFPRT